MKIQAQHTDVPVTPAAVEIASRAGEERAKHSLRIVDFAYLPDFELFLVKLEDGISIGLPTKNYPEFADLSSSQLSKVSLGFGGTALCLDEADLHVSISGLIRASECLVAVVAGLRGHV